MLSTVTQTFGSTERSDFGSLLTNQSKPWLKGGALSKDDSLLISKMKQLSGEACLPSYHESIVGLRHDLFVLHSSITCMELWNIDYLKTGANQEEIDLYEADRNQGGLDSMDYFLVNHTYSTASCYSVGRTPGHESLRVTKTIWRRKLRSRNV